MPEPAQRAADEWALRQASSPTMHGGSPASSLSSANRLNFLRRTTFPCGSKPTMWKTLTRRSREAAGPSH